MDTSFDLRVLDVVVETDDARSVVLEVPEEHAAAFDYRPGQFLTIAVPSDQVEEGLVARAYSLSSSPLEPGPITITVKRTEGGYASGWVHSTLRAGDVLRVLPPSGIFTPKDIDADLLLFAGGSGVTPIMSIIRTALAKGSGRIVLLYANRDERSVIFAGELDRLAREHPERLRVIHWLESVQGLPDAAQLRALAADHDTFDAFVCGPAPFMKAVTGVLKDLGFPRERRHQEKFVSLGGNPFADLPVAGGTPTEVAEIPAESAQIPAESARISLEIELDGTVHSFDDWRSGTTLLEHLESKGVAAPYSCREGACSACAFRLDEGEVVMRHNEVLDDDDLADGIRLGCQSEPAPGTTVVKGSYNG